MTFVHHASRFIVLCLVALVLAAPAWADVAPPLQPPGSNISPGGATQVVMSAERVVIEVQPSEETAKGKVTADFTMHNSGSADEPMQVRFPLGDPSGFGSGYSTFPTVEDFAVQVGGNILPTTVITTPNPLKDLVGTEPVKWAAFDVNFPAGQDTKINVTYTVEATGYVPSARFAYVLETGAGWKDAIGSADIILRLPYEASNENVFYTESTHGLQYVGNEVRWHWNNLEPTTDDNLTVTILAPKAWQAILAARANVTAKPNDGAALAALARAYDGAVTTRFPLEQHDPFATLSEETFSRAIVADPRSAALHAEYARTIWDHMYVQASMTTEDPNLRRVLAEISAALSIDPRNEVATALLAEVRNSVQGTVTVPTPASTLPTPIGTIVPLPVSTMTMPTAIATSAATPVALNSPVIEPTMTVTFLPTPTVGAGSGQSSGQASNVLLVVGTIALPVVAALATFLIVAGRRRNSGAS